MTTNEFLGYICWYSLPSDLLVPLSELEQFRERVDPLIKLPKKPTSVNLFKRACKSVKWKEDKFSYFFSEEWDHTVDGKARYFIEKRKGVYEEPIGIASLGENGELKLEYLGKSPESWDRACFSLKEFYEQAESVDHMAVRSVIKDTLENKLEAVWVNSGTYFIEEQYLDQLVETKNIVRKLNGQFEIIKLLDGKDERVMLHQHYYNLVYSVEEEFYSKLLDLPFKPSAYKVTKLENLIEKASRLETKISQYGDVFGETAYMKKDLHSKLGEI